MSNGQTPNYLNILITKNHENHNYNLRNKNDIAKANLKRKNTQNSLVYSGFKLYNSLPNSIKNNRIEKCFKEEVTNWIKNNINVYI